MTKPLESGKMEYLELCSKIGDKLKSQPPSNFEAVTLKELISGIDETASHKKLPELKKLHDKFIEIDPSGQSSEKNSSESAKVGAYVYPLF